MSSRGGTHPLEVFLRRTFGGPFSRIVMAGYGDAPGARLRPFRLPPGGGDGGHRWVMELKGGNPPPGGNDPLVLAALLKLHFSRPAIHKELEFSTAELLAELGWEDTALMQRGVDHAIEKYATLVYFRHEEGRREVLDGLAGEWGYYSLVTSYSTESATRRGRAQGHRLRNTVHFEEEFVRSLGDGRVVFAGIDFGGLGDADAGGEANDPGRRNRADLRHEVRGSGKA